LVKQKKKLSIEKLHKQGDKIQSHPENVAFPIIEISGDIELEICGVVSGVTRKI